MSVLKKQVVRVRIVFVMIVLCLALLASVSAQSDDLDVWRQHTGIGLTLSTPSAWFDLRDSREFEMALNTLLAINPDVASFVSPSIGVDLFLFDPDRLISLNVTATAVQTVPSLSVLLPLLEAEYVAQGIQVNDAQIVGLPAGNAAWLYLQPTLNGADGNPLQTSQIQYIIPDNNRLIFITMSAPVESFVDNLQVFAQIADTVELPGSLGGWARFSGTDLSIRVPFGWRSRSPQTANTQIATGLPDASATFDLSVTSSDSSQSITDLIDRVQNTYDEQARAIISLERVRLPAGEFVRGETAVVEDGSERIVVDYIGIINGANPRTMTATFTVNADLAEGRLPIFAVMMHTLRVQ